jgi:hypothetical protein
MNLPLFGLANPWNRFYLLEVEQGIDADVIILFVDSVKSELAVRL